MNLKQFAGVDAFYRDLNTGKEIPWHDYMRRVIDKLGIENIKPYIPFEIDYLKGKLKSDVHLNNTSMTSWNAASGFHAKTNVTSKILEYHPIKYGIANLFIHNRINIFSPSECVCVLKETARILCESSDAE